MGTEEMMDVIDKAIARINALILEVNHLGDERAVLRARIAELEPDAALLDCLDAVPFAMEITCHMDQPKSDSVPSMRSQIEHFISMGLEAKK